MPYPADPDIVLGSCKGQFEWMSLVTGQSKPYWVGVQSLYGMPTNELIYRIQRVAPMDTSPHDPKVIYYGTQYVHRTRDLGVNWERISPDLTWNPPQHQGISGVPITRDLTGEEIYSTLYAIRESVLEPGVIWVGANDGPFHITRDDGCARRGGSKHPRHPLRHRSQRTDDCQPRPGMIRRILMHYGVALFMSGGVVGTALSCNRYQVSPARNQPSSSR